MKKFIYLLFLLLLIPVISFAGFGYKIISGNIVSGGLGCTTSDDTEIYAYTTGTSNATFGASTWKAAKVVLSNTTRVTALTVNLRDLATVDACNVICSLYTDSGGSGPASEVAGTQVSISESSITDALESVFYDFNLSIPVEVSAGTYWIVFRSDHASETGGGRFFFNTGAPSGSNASSTDSGSSWALGISYYNVKIMGCD